ncbi:hypothetical protein D3C77_571390 [compost metagenome]
MQGISLISHWSDTGLVVSGVEDTSIRSTPSSRISSLATSAARLGLDWLSLTSTSRRQRWPPTVMLFFSTEARLSMM